MLAVVLFMVAGMVLGRLLKIRNIGKPVIVMTWLLLLFLGWEAGSDREVIAALPSIGIDSALLSLGGVAGSCLLAWLLWVFMGRKLDAVKAGAKEDGNGAKEDGNGVTSEGIKAGGERKMSAWTGFGGSLVILGFFAAGVVLGLCGLLGESRAVHLLSTWSLRILMMMVGMSVGGDREMLRSLKTMNPKLLLLPLATIAGTYAGCILVNLFLSYEVKDVLAVGSGFGYYSLSSVLISESRGAFLGTVALISNIIREVFTLLFTPLLVRVAGPLAPISAGGATTADTTLPVISSSCGQNFILVSVFHGFTVDLSVPFLVSLFCS